MTTRLDNPEDSRLTRWSLLERLRNQFDDESWCTFYDAYSKLIHTCARDHALSAIDADEVVEEVLVRAWQTIPDPNRFAIHRRPGFIPPMAHDGNTVSHPRPQAAAAAQENRHVSLDDCTDEDEARTETTTELNALCVRAFEEDWGRRWSAEILAAAVELLKGQVKARQFQIFSLNVLEEQPADTVAKCLGVGAATVHLTVFRMKQKLRENLRHLERE